MNRPKKPSKKGSSATWPTWIWGTVIVILESVYLRICSDLGGMCFMQVNVHVICMSKNIFSYNVHRPCGWRAAPGWVGDDINFDIYVARSHQDSAESSRSSAFLRCEVCGYLGVKVENVAFRWF
jgi:hypothetical protein